MIAGVCAAILFIVMFLGWFGAPDTIETGGIEIDVGDAAAAAGVDVDTTASAWQAYDFTDIVLLVTIIVAVAGAVATLMARDVALPVAASALTAGLGILSFVLVLWSIINTPSEGDFDSTREFWVYVGLLLTAGIAYGGWMSMQEEGTSFGDQVDRLQGEGAASPPPPAQPPPPTSEPPPASSGPPPSGGPPPQGPAA